MASASDKSGKLQKNIEEKLNCPVCLEVYKTPRALSCLHTFCEKCLKSCILKEVEKGTVSSAIHCPVCRKETVPPAPSKPPADWASQLPMNYAILPMFESMESESRKCGNCARRNKESNAKYFCKDCNQFQCNNCIASHADFEVMEDHKIVGLNEMEASPDVNLVKVEFCKEHDDKKLEFFCEDHGMLCCSTCAIVNHRTCKQVNELKKLGCGIKDGTKSQQKQSQMEELVTQLDKTTEILENNMTDIAKQADEIPRQVEVIRNKAAKKLDKFVREVSSRCDQLKKLHHTEINDKITSVRSLEAAITSSRKVLEAMMKHGTEAQIFITFHQFEEQVRQYQEQTKAVCSNTVTTELSLSLSRELEDFNCTKPLAIIDYKDETVNEVPIVKCLMKKTTTTIQDGGSRLAYTGATHLPDGRLVVSEWYSQHCRLLNNNYSVAAQVKLPSANPRNLAVIGPAEVVVVHQGSRCLQRVSVGEQLTLNGTIPCTRTPKCLSRVSDSELAVGWEVGLGIIMLDGKEKLYMDKDKSGRQINFCVHSCLVVNVDASRFYQSSRTSNSVFCIGFSGEAHFTYTNNLNQPTGVALDRDGNIYVCSFGSKCVHQVGPNGEALNIIDMEFPRPYTICCGPAGNEMTVMDVDNSTKIAQVKYEPPTTDCRD